MTNNGTLDIEGNVTLENNINNNGTLNWINGSITSTAGSTLANKNGGILNITAGNQPTVEINFVNEDGGTINKNIGASQIISTSFDNQSNGTVNVAATLDLRGTITNNGDMNGGGTYLFGGSAMTTLNGTGSISRLNVNNTGNLDITGTQTIGTALFFTNGKILLQGANDLIVNGTISGASNSNYVVTSGTGRLRRTADGSTSYPVGPTTASYNPVTINQMGGPADFGVRVAVGLNNANGADIVNREWTIDNLLNAPNADVTLQWDESHESGTFDRSACRISRWTGSGWQAFGTGNAPGSGTYTRIATGVTAFSPFGVGSGLSLPVELVDFRVTLLDNNTSQLNWQTASELNNKGFEIERSTDWRTWEKLGFMAGQGTTNETQGYQYIDTRPFSGINYYRLRQMDYDGQYDYSQVRSIVFNGGTGTGIHVYPNPVQNGLLNINFTAEQEGAATLRIFDTSGKMLHRETLANQHNQIGFGKLSAGIYFIEVASGHEVWRERLIVQ